MVRTFLGVFPSVCSFWILTVCLSLVFWTPVGGQIQVIGSHEPVKAAPGEDVVLKCLVIPKFDIRGKTVEWSKLELKVNPVDPSYVYLYRNRREDVVLMFPSYVGRTKLFTEALKDGNILLLIKNVTLADNGQYKCFIPDLKGASQHSIVTLVVDPNYDEMITTQMPLEPTSLQTPEPTDMDVKGQRYHLIPVIVLIILLILVFGVGLIGCLLQRIKHQPEDGGGSVDGSTNKSKSNVAMTSKDRGVSSGSASSHYDLSLYVPGCVHHQRPADSQTEPDSFGSPMD